MTTLLRSLALAALLLPAGCLQFDAQEVTLHHDQKQDQLDLMLVYRGLYSNAEMSEAMNQLERAQQTGQFAFWSNWPFRFDLTGATGPAAALVQHVDVENGGLFTDPAGLLCGFQFVRVREVKGFLQKVNTLVQIALRTQVIGKPLGEEQHRIDDETEELLEEVLRGRVDVVSLQGSAIVLTLPCSDRDHAWLVRHLGNDLLRDAGRAIGGWLWRNQDRRPADADAPAGHGNEAPDGSSPATPITIRREQVEAAVAQVPELRFLFGNPLSLQRLAGRTVVTIGFPHVADNVLRKDSAQRYQPNLAPELAAKQIPCEQGVPDQELARRFAAFHERKAELPPKLAEERGAK